MCGRLAYPSVNHLIKFLFIFSFLVCLTVIYGILNLDYGLVMCWFAIFLKEVIHLSLYKTVEYTIFMAKVFPFLVFSLLISCLSLILWVNTCFYSGTLVIKVMRLVLVFCFISLLP